MGDRPWPRRVWRNTVCAAGPRCSPRGRVLSRPNAEKHWGSREARSAERHCLGTTIAPRRRATFRQTLLGAHGAVALGAAPPVCRRHGRSQETSGRAEAGALRRARIGRVTPADERRQLSCDGQPGAEDEKRRKGDVADRGELCEIPGGVEAEVESRGEGENEQQ